MVCFVGAAFYKFWDSAGMLFKVVVILALPPYIVGRASGPRDGEP
jgi:hypothetical protein